MLSLTIIIGFIIAILLYLIGIYVKQYHYWKIAVLLSFLGILINIKYS